MNPLLTQMRTYPFAALDEARRSALAAGRTLIDFSLAEHAERHRYLVASDEAGYFRLALVPTMEECQRAVAILEEVL